MPEAFTAGTSLWFFSASVLFLGAYGFSVMTPSTSIRASSVVLQQTTSPLVVALTREEGKNDKLRKELTNILDDTAIVTELPCIAHADGEDFDRLGPILKEDWDYVAVTSPEAARVLGQVWDGSSTISVVAVGKATQAALETLGIKVDFCPSKATAATLVQELPTKGDRTTLLYPASAKAASTLEEGLAARGFEVTRLNTYDTVTATWTNEEQDASHNVRVACFGSPSAVEGWLKNTFNNKEVCAACIGETSAEACRKHEWPEDRLFFPEKPGITGWAAAVEQALEALQMAHT